MACTEIRIVLVVEFHGESVAGHVEDPDGATRPFTGWIGLLSALQMLDRASPNQPSE